MTGYEMLGIGLYSLGISVFPFLAILGHHILFVDDGGWAADLADPHNELDRKPFLKSKYEWIYGLICVNIFVVLIVNLIFMIGNK